jgi:hypothetical protein
MQSIDEVYDDEEDEEEVVLTRKDECIVFDNEKDLKHVEPITIKAERYKGISINVKIVNSLCM